MSLKSLLMLAGVVVGLGLAGSRLHGAEPAPANAATDEAGFGAFLTLGMPELAGACYGRLESGAPDELLESYILEIHAVDLEGNAWRLATPAAGGRASFMKLQGVVVEEELTRVDDEAQPLWQECDLKADLDKALVYIKQRQVEQARAGADPFNMAARYDFFSRSLRGSGYLFLLAVAAWQQGSEAGANELAGAEDETLTRYMRHNIGQGRFIAGEEESLESEAEVRKAYGRMNRLQSRGEIACALLKALCSREELHHAVEADPVTVAAAAGERWRAIRELEWERQALYYLEHGDHEQRMAALRRLLEGEAAAYYDLIETNLLQNAVVKLPQGSHFSRHFSSRRSGRYRSGSDAIETYVTKRGEAAAGFVGRYLATRREMLPPPGPDSDGSGEEELASEALTLRTLASKPDIDAAIKRLTTTGEFSEQDELFVRNTLPRVTATNGLVAMLQAAVGTTNLAARLRIVANLAYLSKAGLVYVDISENSTGTLGAAGRELLLGGVNAAAWQELLADERMTRWGGMGYSVAGQTLIAIERICNPAFYREWWYRYALKLRAPVLATEVLQQRMAGRLTGRAEEELPGIPSAADVTAGRRAELLAALEGGVVGCRRSGLSCHRGARISMKQRTMMRLRCLNLRLN